MRVFLADDQRGVRSALRLLIEQEPGWEVTGEAADAGELAARLLKADPELLLLDWELPGLLAREIPALRSSWPQLKIVVLSGRPEARRPAQESGCDAFLSKGDLPETVLNIIRSL